MKDVQIEFAISALVMAAILAIYWVRLWSLEKQIKEQRNALEEYRSVISGKIDKKYVKMNKK